MHLRPLFFIASRAAGLAAALVLVHATGCSSTDSPAPAENNVPTGPAGGPVAGAADAHCTGDAGLIKQVTSQDACHPEAGAPDAAMEDAAGDGADMGDDYGDTLHGTEGDDDDCKYHVAWTSTPVYENYDVAFSITVTRTADGAVATAAKPYAEVYLDDTHPAPSDGNGAESGGGKYTISGVRFDKPGDWTVRFHLYGDCTDGEESPHGHAAFLVHVP